MQSASADLKRRRPRLPGPLRWLSPALLGFALVAGPSDAQASCDVIPGVSQSFRGARGSLNRPFAIPGDAADQLRLRLDPSGTPPDGCDAGVTPFLVGAEDDYFVTVLFTPPAAGDPRAVVLSTAASAPDCTDLPGIQTVLDACDAELGAPPGEDWARCLPYSIGVDGLRILDADTLGFRFPDTDGLFSDIGDPGTASDDRTFTGPAVLAVTPVLDGAAPVALPCALATTSCADCLAPGSPCPHASHLLACVDQLFAEDGTCETLPPSAELHPVFPYFTALPPANDYQALCRGSAVCDLSSAALELRLTVDADGNLLIPMDWRGVLVVDDRVPIPRLVRGEASVPAFTAGAPGFESAPRCFGGSDEGSACIDSVDCAGGTCVDTLQLPGRGFLGSFSLAGQRLPPLFEPQLDAGGTVTQALFGSVDAPVGVIRIARRSRPFGECSAGDHIGLPCTAHQECPGALDACGPASCRGGQNSGESCDEDADCPGGECGPALFDFTDRLEGSVGPILVQNDVGTLDLESLNPVPIEGLIESPELFAFAESEGIGGSSLNSDADATDSVLRLRDRSTGVILPIGEPDGGGRFEARAVSRLRQPPFSFPAVAIEDDLVAFLEPEPLEGLCVDEGDCDRNNDGDDFDTTLRIFRSIPACDPKVPDCVQELSPSPLVAADSAPVIDGRSLAISKGLVFFRRSEAAGALQRTVLVSVDDDGSQAFSSPVNCPSPDDPGCARIVTGNPTVSHDGSLVAFDSDAHGLVDDDPPGGFTSDVFLRDRDLNGDGRFEDGATDDLTVRVSNRAGGGAALSGAVDPSLSQDGSFVAFQSADPFLLAQAETNADVDVYLWDVGLGSMVPFRMSADASGNEGNGDSEAPALSEDGRYVAFESLATNLLSSGDSNGQRDVFVVDRDPDENGTLDDSRSVLRVSVDSSGNETAPCTPSCDEPAGPAMSGDGRRVAFISDAEDLVAPDGNGAIADAYVHDRDPNADGLDGSDRRTERVNTASGGEQGTSRARSAAISSDGRFVAFRSLANNLVPGDTNGQSDIFLRDLENGALTRVSVASDGSQLTRPTKDGIGLSADGRFVAFVSVDSEHLPGPQSGVADVFVHDRLTGLTSLVSSLDPGGCDVLTAPPLSECDSDAGQPAISGDGRFVVFQSLEDWVVPPLDDANQEPDIFSRGPDFSDPAELAARDLNGDFDLADVLLFALDTTVDPPQETLLGPANQVSVSEGAAAYLSPDGVNEPGLRWWPPGGPAQLLADDAIDVAASPHRIAAILRKPGGDAVDVFDRSGAVVAEDLGAGAQKIQVVGTVVALLTAAGELQVHDTSEPASPPLVPPLTFAEDFVLGERIVAFRASEAKAGADLNLDGDQCDDVLRVFDHGGTRELLDSQQAVLPCPFEHCDPRLPYRVVGDVVTFLTVEAEQGPPGNASPDCLTPASQLGPGCITPAAECDLNGDGDSNDVVKQLFNARQAAAALPAAPGLMAAVNSSGGVQPIASASAGFCTNTGAACARDPDCDDGLSAGRCFVPPGVCIGPAPSGETCTIDADGEVAGCPNPGEFCFPTSATAGNCFEERGACEGGSCNQGDQCVDDEIEIHRLVGPISPQQPDGAQVQISAGTCVEPLGQVCSVDGDCGVDRCSEGGFCQRRRNSCLVDADCELGTCEADLLYIGAADSDADGLADPLDNCENSPNPDQRDQDSDGLGDACDRMTVGVAGDADLDGIADLSDNCPAVWNPGQEDVEADGYGDACECGDEDGDGRLTTVDALKIRQCVVEIRSCTGTCDTDGDGDCDTIDAFRVRKVVVELLTKEDLSCAERPAPNPFAAREADSMGGVSSASSLASLLR